MVKVLFPGRHHMLTRFQKNYLRNLVTGSDKKIDEIIFAVTSSDHANTRRNPIPFYLRTMGIERFSKDLPCKVKIYPIPDVEPTKRFASYILSQIFYQGGEKITPKNTILACSTPSVIKMFKKLGFKNLPVELVNAKKNKYCSLRPYEVIDLLVSAKKNWKKDNKWKNYASSASTSVYLEYNLGDLIIELFNDSLLTEDADITKTRDYNTYSRGMDKNIEFKFNDIKPFIKQGKIVDVGCGTGSLIELLAKNFPESDIIGIEATRKFYEFCRLQDYPNPFVFFYRRNILDQNFKKNTINTFIYSSILHEIHSYIGKSSLRKLLKSTYMQLAHKGRIVIRDVVGPENKNKQIFLELSKKDGKSEGKIEKLSTYAKFFKFVKDFKPDKIKFKKVKIEDKELIKIKLKDAYEFISKMNYTDNWKSEMSEEFGFWSFTQWKKELEKSGFKIIAGSRTLKSDYIINNMYKGKATIFTMKNKKLVLEEYPPTNMILAGIKPKISK